MKATEENIKSVTSEVNGIEAVIDLMVGDETEQKSNLVSEQIAFYNGWNELRYEKTLDIQMRFWEGVEQTSLNPDENWDEIDTDKELPQIRLFESKEFEDARSILVYFDYTSGSKDTTTYWMIDDDSDAERIITNQINSCQTEYSDENGAFKLYYNENSFEYNY